MISHVISWYAHIWYHSMISHCDVICDVTSLAFSQAPGPPSLVAEGATSSLSAEAWSTNPKSTPAPSPPPPLVSAASAASGAVAAALLLETGPRAANTSRQNCCTAGGSQRGIPVPVVQKNQTMRKRDFAHWQIDQTRDILKIGYHFSEIVRWKISTNFRCLTSVERGGDCVGSDVMKCQGNSIGRDILKIEYQFKKSTIMKHS